MDSSSLKPQPVIAEVLPGFTVLAVLGAAYFYGHPEQSIRIARSGPTVAAVGGASLLLSWIVGTFLDAIGNILEETWLHRQSPLNWDYLMTAPAERVTRLNEWYLAYYLLDRNYALATVLLLFVTPLARLLGWIHLTPALWWLFAVAGVVACVVFAFDAYFLRNEICDQTASEPDDPHPLPHEDAYTRLGVSQVHGVGVFAIKDIDKGTLVFGADDDDTAIVVKKVVDQLHDPELRRLYHDFCVLRGDEYECPVTFNKLTPAWYLNDCGNGEPNVEADAELLFRAIRYIRAGEELLSRYSDYSDNEK